MTIVRQTKKPAWEPRLNVRISDSTDGPRPLTATLDHPLVLNVALLSKLDMTAFTKEGLLMVSKLCAVPMIKRDAKPRNRRRGKGAASAAARSCVEGEEPSTASEIHSIPGPTLKEAKRKNHPKGGKVDDLFGKAILPEPCRTCGRPEQPERLHSHPPAHPGKSAIKSEKPNSRVVSKPVAANYKSITTKTPISTMENRTRPHSARPRTITCYICSREFGTASFPLHEPKCMEKWDRENKLLPAELRRKRPERPTGKPNSVEWNESAWQSSQTALVSCNKCGRTFNPDRLAVHSRSCQGTAEGSSQRPTTSPSPNQGIPPRPPTVPCYICGREFGSRSIAVHEPQCLRKWRCGNANLPLALQRPEPHKPEIDISRITGCYICGDQMAAKERMIHERSCLQGWRRANSARPEGERLPEPARPDYRFTEGGEVDYHGTWHSIWSNHVESLIPCRHCGRKFFPDRIERHEAACGNLPIKSKTIR